MPNHMLRIATLSIATLGFAAPAHAGGLEDLKKYLAKAQQYLEDAREIERDFEGLSSEVKTKLKAKKQRLKNAAKGFVLVADALKKGRPIPLYVTKPGGVDVACGDKIWVHNAAQDKVLHSAHGKEGKPLYIRVNVAWGAKGSKPNFRVHCRDKAKGKPLAYGDAFLLELDPAAGLDDGKPWFHAGTKVGYDPIVRLDDMDEIEKLKAYWFFRGGEGTVQTGIPMEIVATNRKADGNVGGFCGAGPKGALPVVAFNMSNHCGHIELVAGIGYEGIGTPPKWTKDLGAEIVALAKELRAEIEKAGSSGSGTTTTSAGPRNIFQ
jgi:hypothetical protein